MRLDGIVEVLRALKDYRDIVAAAGVEVVVLDEDLFVLNDSCKRFRTNIVEDKEIAKKRPIWAFRKTTTSSRIPIKDQYL